MAMAFCAQPSMSFYTEVCPVVEAVNPPSICLTSWRTDHRLPCPLWINLSRDLWPPVTAPFTERGRHALRHTFLLPHPSSIWIMHHQTVGSNESIAQRAWRDTRSLWWLYQAVPSLRLYSAPDVQGAGWWIMGHPSPTSSAVSPH